MTVASERVVNGIKTRVLHGKDYVEVAERVRIAHSGDAEFEQKATEQFSIGDHWFVRCVILVKGKQYIGTAEIKFTAPKNTPDGTNPFECAETSALGRALAFAGLGTVESIASFDEVYRVQSIEEAEMGGRPVIEAAKPKQIVAPQPASVKAKLYELGKAKGMWDKPEEFYAAVSTILDGKPVNASSWAELTAKEIMHVEQIIRDEPVAKSA